MRMVSLTCVFLLLCLVLLLLILVPVRGMAEKEIQTTGFQPYQDENGHWSYRMTISK